MGTTAAATTSQSLFVAPTKLSNNTTRHTRVCKANMVEQNQMQAEFEKLKIKQTALQIHKLQISSSDTGAHQNAQKHINLMKKTILSRPSINEPIKLDSLFQDKTLMTQPTYDGSLFGVK